jgi:hypothetical protein
MIAFTSERSTSLPKAGKPGTTPLLPSATALAARAKHTIERRWAGRMRLRTEALTVSRRRAPA